MKPYARRPVARSAGFFHLRNGIRRRRRKALSNRSCLTRLTELEYTNHLCALKPARTALQHGRTMGASEFESNLSPQSRGRMLVYSLSFLSQGGSLMKKSVIVISGVMMGAFLMAPLSSFAGGTVTGKVTYSGKSDQKEFLFSKFPNPKFCPKNPNKSLMDGDKRFLKTIEVAKDG